MRRSGMGEASDPAVRLYPGVSLGPDAVLGDYVVIGCPPRAAGPDSLQTRIGENANIRSHTVIYAGNTIGNRFQTGHGVLVRELNRIGDDVSIGSHSILEHHVTIGNRVRLHSGVFIPEFSILEDDTWVGPHVTFTNALYPLSPSAKSRLQGPHLMPGAKIGANSTILPGVVVGRNSLVGAGSVVIRDVPDGKVVVGNPARVVKDVADIPDYSLGDSQDR
jgi:acetyltransferase-like isoleucine patch superfamily enzyme